MKLGSCSPHEKQILNCHDISIFNQSQSKTISVKTIWFVKRFMKAQKSFFFIKKCGEQLMPCLSTGPKMFCASPKIWSHLVPLQNLLFQLKKQIYWIEIIFWCGTKCFGLVQNVIWIFGLAQNIFEPIEGQDISCLLPLFSLPLLKKVTARAKSLTKCKKIF